MLAEKLAICGALIGCLLWATTTNGATPRDFTANEFKPYEVNAVPVVVLAVDFLVAESPATRGPGRGAKMGGAAPRAPEFLEKGFFTRDLISDKVFGLRDSKRQLNAYYRWTSYGQLKLVPAQGLEQSLMAHVTLRVRNHAEIEEKYTFDSKVGTIEELNQNEKIMRFVSDAVTEMLKTAAYDNVSFQDALLMVLVNISGKEWGRGAMGFLPNKLFWELGVGPDPKAPKNRICFTIGKDHTYRDYILSRREHFNGGQDQFVQGVAMFCRDGQLSCAPHDIINVLKRASSVPPKRATVIKGLYNNYLQDIWQKDGKTNTSPYIGWWDDMADHLHMKVPPEPSRAMFFRSTPQGMCAYTRLVMGWIPDDYVATVPSGSKTVSLAPLGVDRLPEPKGKVHLAVKVPLAPAKDQNGNSKERYYLIEARRLLGNDDVQIDKSQYYGDRSYLPDRLIQEEGVLVYMVDQSKPVFGSKPEGGQVDRRNFVLVLEDQAGRRDGDLRDAAFSPGQAFRGEEGVRVDVAVDPASRQNFTLRIQR
jgi:hypothetical protein